MITIEEAKERDAAAVSKQMAMRRRIRQAIELFLAGCSSLKDISELTGIHYSHLSDIINLRAISTFRKSDIPTFNYGVSESDMIARSSDEICVARYNTPCVSDPSFPEQLRQALDKTNQ